MNEVLMTVEFNNVKVNISNAEIANKIKRFITRAAKPRKAVKRWTDAEVLVAEGMFKDGKNIGEIAEAINRTIPAVLLKLKGIGYDTTTKPTPQEINL